MMKTTFLIGATSLAISATSFGAITGDAITIDIVSSIGSVHHTIPVSALTHDSVNGEFDFTLTSPLIFLNTTGQLIARIDHLNLFALSDPSMALGFDLHSGSAVTTFSISTGSNNFDQIFTPT